MLIDICLQYSTFLSLSGLNTYVIIHKLCACMRYLMQVLLLCEKLVAYLPIIIIIIIIIN